MKIRITNLEDKSNFILDEKKFMDFMSSYRKNEILKEIENLKISEDRKIIKFNNNKFECVMFSETETLREMVNIFYSLNFYTKEYDKMKKEDEFRKEEIKELLAGISNYPIKENSLFYNEKKNKKVPYYNKNRPF